jgi:hypothetical protein
MFCTDGLCDNFSPDIDFSEWVKNCLIENRDKPLEAMADVIMGLNGIEEMGESDKYRMDDMSLVLCRL